MAVSALALALAACDGGGDPVQQALRDASAERHAAALKTTEELERQTPVSRTTETADEANVARLIADHEAAIATARRMLDQSQDPDLRRIAQATLDTRTTELAELRAWQAGR
ncbi:MAG: DUF305 domain-containing protein [Brevundimonas sp.]|nr:DUF305 domain-containing protein [Brevundimonas sp.]